MSFELREMNAEEYAARVLPHTHALWAAGRPMDAYVSQTSSLAQSAYGRKSYRTFSLAGDAGSDLASFKRYERAAIAEGIPLRAIGIGAVFTPEDRRKCGYASAMLGLALDRAKNEGFDFAYLFSDIHPQFYKELGFHELPSRAISLRADALAYTRVAVEPIGERDWSGVRKCFETMDGTREWRFLRSPSLWEWLRLRRSAQGAFEDGHFADLLVRGNRGIAAYVLGRREPARDAYVLEEFGCTDAGSDLIPALLRSAAADLRRIAGWLPPDGARRLLPRGSVRRRADAIWMIAPLSANGTRFLGRAQAASPADGVWPLDHI